ncbi:MAG TPA: peptidoglycan DD-metalloendopeptidase family protein [Pseudohaliea sp.]|nr:peptidoglycan DD-metalloendopeptidase family protein [Pseudohaliea sp.]HKL63805.1 peptidoglycan DD-metalloendopeptidase family protein [Woeseiaceae bacterium]
MNVVIFSRRRTGVRQIDLAAPLTLAAAGLVVGIFAAAVFGGGYFFAQQHDTRVDAEELRAMAEQLDAQRREIEAARRQTEETLDALAIRLGQMNAHVIRLDALGRRLTEMAELEDGEFDFESPPAIGGPEEPEELGGGGVADIMASLDGLSQQLSDREKQLGVLESVLLTRNLNEQIRPAGRPLQSGWLSSYYGRRTDPFTGKPSWHKGVDFAGKAGAEIVAVAAGVVTYSGSRYGFGKMVEIDHGDGYVTRYAHNAENFVNAGDEVRKGQLIAHMGQTGRATGPNLHFEVLFEGKPVNPLKYIRASDG